MLANPPPAPSYAASSSWTTHLAHAAIAALAKDGKMTGKDVARAIKQCKIDVEKANPDGA